MATTAHTNKGIVLILACAAQFMVVLDVAIVNVALPSIQKELGIGQATSQWIVIAYGLMLGGFLLLGGRLADLLGRRRMLLTGLTLFSLASLLAGGARRKRSSSRHPGPMVRSSRDRPKRWTEGRRRSDGALTTVPGL